MSAVKKLRSRGGFTMVEMLCAVLVLVLASGAMAMEVTFATRTYNDSMATSQAQTLSSTLSTAVKEELRYAEVITAGTDGKNVTYSSLHYGDGASFGVNSDGQVTVKGEKLLSSAAYDAGMTASTDITYINGLFSAVITVKSSKGAELAESTFSVRPLNG